MRVMDECSWEKNRFYLEGAFSFAHAMEVLSLEGHFIQMLVGFGVGFFVGKVTEVTNPLPG